MIKLKQLYNEIKLIPQNRILLKKNAEPGYYFQDDEKFNHYIYKFELDSGKALFTRNTDSLISFLKKKKIPFNTKKSDIITIDVKYEVIIDAKYFITPNKLSEIKLVQMDKLPTNIEIYEEKDIDKYPSLKLYKINNLDAKKIYDYFLKVDGDDYTDFKIEGLTVYDASKKLDSESGYLDEWFAHIISALFPNIHIFTPYGTF